MAKKKKKKSKKKGRRKSKKKTGLTPTNVLVKRAKRLKRNKRAAAIFRDILN